MALKISIDKAMKRLGKENDAITTVINSSTQGCKGKADPLPFLRICSTDLAEIEEIIRALKKECIGRQHVDIETFALSRFILAKEMR